MTTNRHADASPPDTSRFLPMTREEMDQRGWDALDVLIITGDAYVDHPAFGAAVIGRVLDAEGYRVGIIAQPDWRDPQSINAMGRPELFVGVTAGAMDSMVANYTANRKIRRDDAYTPGGVAGHRPNYATAVYSSLARHIFPGIPVVIGGIEASLRRFAHYDYWKNRVRRSMLLDAKADLLVAGMGERQVTAIARRLREGRSLHEIPGTVEAYSQSNLPENALDKALTLPSLEEISQSPQAYMDAATHLEKAVAASIRKPIIQRHGDRAIIEWPPEEMAPERATELLDAVYALPYQRRAHPSYREKIPALEPVQFSVVSHRGCFGGCTFCALALHQGKHVTPRSEDSILREIRSLTRHPAFHGTITDIGGPSANMYAMKGREEHACETCRRTSCLFPTVCTNLNTSHEPQVRLLRRALEIPGVKHLYIASGIRYDLIMNAAGNEPRSGAREYLALLVGRLVGGHLSAAPEHADEKILHWMRKPQFEIFRAFERLFQAMSARENKQQYIIPYFIASFPGSTEQDMRHVRDYLKESGRRLQQIQDFLPAPMTLATAMYYTERDPRTLERIYVAKSEEQRRRQRDILLYHQKREDAPPRRAPDKSKRPAQRKTRSGGPRSPKTR